jgi:predicted dienelactone hydrolase
MGWSRFPGEHGQSTLLPAEAGRGLVLTKNGTRPTATRAAASLQPRRSLATSTVMDQLQAEAAGTGESVFGPELVNRLNLDRFGIMGWSLGGATAINIQKVDPRIAVGVSFDGIPREANDDPPTKPTLLLASKDSYTGISSYRDEVAKVVRRVRAAGSFADLYLVGGVNVPATHDIYHDGEQLAASDAEKPRYRAQQVAITSPAIALFDAVFQGTDAASAVAGAVAENAAFLEQVDVK